jgi:hypothetical protein
MRRILLDHTAKIEEGFLLRNVEHLAKTLLASIGFTKTKLVGKLVEVP